MEGRTIGYVESNLAGWKDRAVFPLVVSMCMMSFIWELMVKFRIAYEGEPS